MKIKEANIRRLTSLSALGATTLGITPREATASGIVYSGILDQSVLRGGAFIGPGGAGATFHSAPCGLSCSVGPLDTVFLRSHLGSRGTGFRFLRTDGRIYPKGFSTGALWGPAFQDESAASARLVRWSLTASFGSAESSAFNQTDRYSLFRFVGGNLSQDLYGWAQFVIGAGNSCQQIQEKGKMAPHLTACKG